MEIFWLGPNEDYYNDTGKTVVVIVLSPDETTDLAMNGYEYIKALNSERMLP